MSKAKNMITRHHRFYWSRKTFKICGKRPRIYKSFEITRFFFEEWNVSTILEKECFFNSWSYFLQIIGIQKPTRKVLKSSMFSLRLVHFEPQLLFLDISYFGFSDLYALGKITIVEFLHFANKFRVFLIIVELTYVSF